MAKPRLQQPAACGNGHTPFGDALACLHAGGLLPIVLAMVLGECSQGRAALVAWMRFLQTIPDYGHRRQVVEQFLRVFEHAQRHGSQWRVTGAAAFVGHQHELVFEPPRRQRFQICPETGEAIPLEQPARWRRSHVPQKRSGALAARMGRSARTLHRDRALMRRGGIMDSRRPPADASDATLPKRRQPNGRWAYAHHWLRLPPTPEMLRRWGARPRPTTPRPPRASAPSAQALRERTEPSALRDELAAAIADLASEP
jgi:hypothetical protein